MPEPANRNMAWPLPVVTWARDEGDTDHFIAEEMPAGAVATKGSPLFTDDPDRLRLVEDVPVPS